MASTRIRTPQPCRRGYGDNGHRPDILDLSNIGGRRPKVKLHDGETYEVVSPSDLGPVFGAQFKEFYEEYTALEDKPESTEGGRRVSVLRRQEGAPVLLG